MYQIVPFPKKVILWLKCANPSTGGLKWETQPGVEVKKGFVDKTATVQCPSRPMGP